MQPPRACDRCHSIRARCNFAEGQSACDRCHRLRHACHTNRKVRKAGRPRKKPLSPEDDALGDLNPREVQLARYFLDNQRILVNDFVNESNFSVTTESQLIRLLISAPGRIKDALLALAGALISEHESGGSVLTGDQLDRVSKAIERLRRTRCSSISDARATLFAALSLISFHDISIGYGFLPVARAALLSVQPFYNELMKFKSSDFDPHLIPVIFAETSECTRCREVPTIRYDSSQTQVVDRSYGIAQECLPHLYDICVLSNDIKTGSLDAAFAKQRASELHLQLSLWNPILRTDIEDHENLHISPTQQQKMIRHAECYRSLAQILLYQLEEDHYSSFRLAEKLRHDITSISSELMEPQSPVQFLLFPYFVACTEIQDEIERQYVLDNMKYLSGGIATQSCNSMYNFLEFHWTNLDRPWFDLSDNQNAPRMSIGP